LTINVQVTLIIGITGPLLIHFLTGIVIFYQAVITHLDGYGPLNSMSL